MSESTIAALVGFLTVVLLKVADSLLPKGYHFKFMERFIRPDEDDDEPDAT